LNGNKVGTLALSGRGEIYFQYDQDWLSSGFDIAPYDLEFSAKPQVARSSLFGGLHGVFNDSLPDGWGLLLMDRALKASLGWDRASITPLDRLAYIGHRAMGALVYEPELMGLGESAVDLSQLARSAEKLLDGDESSVLPQLLLHGGSPGGARPKVTIARRLLDGSCVSGFQPLCPGFEHWIVKFNAKEDPVDMARIERAYAEMAHLAGLNIPATDLIEVDSDETSVETAVGPYFGTKRFDRLGDVRVHMLSLSGHLYASHRLPSMDYEGILAATHRITGSIAEVGKAFRLMTFNALAHNRDDHTKNFAFLFHDKKWTLSPAFDLTQSYGMGGQHTSSINGSGNPTRKDILAMASAASITKSAAETIVEEVAAGIAQWYGVADRFGVTEASSESVQALLHEMRSRTAPVVRDRQR
jgi:serine/threonine-protein kinase HipA